MTVHDAASRRTPRDLGDGLVLRWTTADDAERVADLNARVFRDKEEAPLNHRVRAVTFDFMAGRNTLIGPEDFVVVEDTRRGQFVASSCLMAQEWTYEGLPFAVGRPEFVGTDLAYRNRGLIRAIFQALHEESAARGQAVQAITGIAYFYRQFGYEYALDLDGYRLVQFSALPEAPKEEPEPCTLREATPDDLPFIMALHERRHAGEPVRCLVPEAFWRATFGALDREFNTHWRLWTILDGAGAPAGFARTSTHRWRGNFNVWDIAVRDGIPLHRAAPAVLRALRAVAEATPDSNPEFADKPCRSIALYFGREHPVYDLLGPSVAVAAERIYAWYVRVTDLPAFLRHLAPVLERRLGASPLAGYSGDLRLDFYREGLRLTFADGRLTGAAPWRRPHWGERAQGGFPPLVFLQLLFGRRSLADLQDAFPDVFAEDEVGPLLNILFPKVTTNVIYLE